MRGSPERPCPSCGAPLEPVVSDDCTSCAHTRPELFAKQLEHAAEAFALADRMQHDFCPSEGLLDQLLWSPKTPLPTRTHAEWLAHMEARFERIAAVGVRVLGPAVDDEAELEPEGRDAGRDRTDAGACSCVGRVCGDDGCGGTCLAG